MRYAGRAADPAGPAAQKPGIPSWPPRRRIACTAASSGLSGARHARQTLASNKAAPGPATCTRSAQARRRPGREGEPARRPARDAYATGTRARADAATCTGGVRARTPANTRAEPDRATGTGCAGVRGARPPEPASRPRRNRPQGGEQAKQASEELNASRNQSKSGAATGTGCAGVRGARPPEPASRPRRNRPQGGEQAKKGATPAGGESGGRRTVQVRVRTPEPSSREA